MAAAGSALASPLAEDPEELAESLTIGLAVTVGDCELALMVPNELDERIAARSGLQTALIKLCDKKNASAAYFLPLLFTHSCALLISFAFSFSLSLSPTLSPSLSLFLSFVLFLSPFPDNYFL